MKKTIALLLAVLMLCGMTALASAADGTYSATVPGMHGPLTVEVTLAGDKIEKVELVDNVETPGLIDWPASIVTAAIVENQSLDVDVISGVTISSRAIIRGAEEALKSAGVDVEPFKAPRERTANQDAEYEADVVIVGGGGSGLSAAVRATEAGASVILIEKMGFLGGNSIMVGGIYNAPDHEYQDYAEFPGNPNSLVEDAIAEPPVSGEHKALQEAVAYEYEEFKKTDKVLFDSLNWFALQTWNGGDKLAILDNVKVLAQGSYEGLKWLESMGMEFVPGVHLGGGSLYPRTHQAVMPNGTGYIKAFRDTLAGRDNLTILMDTEGKELIVEDGRVTGIKAEGKDGETVTLKAKNGVVLTTGGFAGNVEMRMKYCQGEKWPDLGPGLITSNMPGVTGDGILMAEAAGAKLFNMDQIQLLPFCNPLTGATGDITTINIYVNKEGKRYVREDGRRDEMALATIAQTDSMYYSIYGTDDPSQNRSLGGMTAQYYLDNNLYGYVIADSLEGIAEKIGIPADNLLKTIEDFNAHVESGEKDEFGRTTYSTKIEGKYYIAYPRKAAAHHTMGGVLIDTEAHALKADGSILPGLYCAGEITGVVHGSNRLGGNAVVDFTVYGSIAGINAAAGK